MNKKHITILIIIIVLATVAGVLWYTKNNTTDIYSESNANSQNIVIPDTDRESHENNQEENAKILYNPDGTIDTSNWQTYRNEEYGFEMMYPERWMYKETHYVNDLGSQVSFVVDEGEDCRGGNWNEYCHSIRVSVAYASSGKKSVEEGKLGDQCLCNISPLNILSGVQYIESCYVYALAQDRLMYSFRKNEVDYTLSVNVDGDDPQPQLCEAAVDHNPRAVIGKRILQSFKFIHN